MVHLLLAEGFNLRTILRAPIILALLRRIGVVG